MLPCLTRVFLFDWIACGIPGTRENSWDPETAGLRLEEAPGVGVSAGLPAQYDFPPGLQGSC